MQSRDVSAGGWARSGLHVDSMSAPPTVAPARAASAGTRAGAFPPLVEHRAPRRRLYQLLEGRRAASVRVAVDLLASSAAVGLASLSAGATSAAVTALPLLVVVMLHMRGMYRRSIEISLLDGVGPVSGAISAAAMTVLAFSVFVSGSPAAGSLIGRAWGFNLALVLGARMGLGLLQRSARSRRLVARPALIVGAGLVGERIARRLDERPEYGLEPIGFLDADPRPVAAREERRLPVLGAPDDLAAVVSRTGAEHVILAFSSAPDRTLVQLTRECEQLGVEASLVPRLFESINDRVALQRLGGLPLLGLSAIDPKGWQFKVKYVLDRPLAALALLALAPLMLAAAVAVKLSSPGPIFFRQRRVGRDGQVFDLLKFRSMRVEDPEDDPFTPLPDRAPGGVEGHDRRTPAGRLLRRLSIDETPQLLNVLKGDMSVVGPRPERPEFAEMFAHDYSRYGDRHRVKSGITGWAQVHGLRGQTSLSDRIEWDNAYIENWSLWLDFKVLLMTLRAAVLSGDNV